MKMTLGAAAAVVMLSACGGSDSDSGFSASFADHGDSLTDQPGDNVAELSVVESDEDLPINRLLATFEDPGGTATAYSMELTVDANGDGLLGAGDTVLFVEPPANVIDDSDVGGPEFVFTLYKELEGNRVEELHSELYAPQ